jgi:hypothetical protein
LASTPPTDQSFLREVDEAVRKEELLGFWRRFGRWIVVAVVAGLLAFGGWIAWKHFSHKASGEVSEQAAERGRPEWLSRNGLVCEGGRRA